MEKNSLSGLCPHALAAADLFYPCIEDLNAVLQLRPVQFRLGMHASGILDSFLRCLKSDADSLVQESRKRSLKPGKRAFQAVCLMDAAALKKAGAVTDAFARKTFEAVSQGRILALLCQPCLHFFNVGQGWVFSLCCGYNRSLFCRLQNLLFCLLLCRLLRLLLLRLPGHVLF